MTLCNNGLPQRHGGTEVSEVYNLKKRFLEMTKNGSRNGNKFIKITLLNNPLRLCASVAKKVGELQ